MNAFNPDCKKSKSKFRRHKAKHNDEFFRQAKKFEKLKRENPENPDFSKLDFRKIENEKNAKFEKRKKRKFEKLKISDFENTLAATQRTKGRT